MKDYCKEISHCWLLLNPHMTVQGCTIDDAGTVRLGLWYSRNNRQQPLEMVMGNPASQVLKTLRNALNEEARAKRLMKATGSRVIGEAAGNSKSGEKGERDK